MSQVLATTPPAPEKKITFVQFDVPPLKAGEYLVTATQTTQSKADPDQFSDSKSFAVAGDRFQLSSGAIVSVFPPDLANGEFDGVLPHVVVTPPTRPWQRTSIEGDPSAPWLAVLLFEAAELPKVTPATAADLLPLHTAITVAGSSVTGTGAMPVGTISYPDINPLDYGQGPTDACSVIDVPVALFSQVAPAAADLPYLAHIRRTDTYDSEDSVATEVQVAVVQGNRLARTSAEAYAVLVSLENMGDLLPNDDGTPSANIPAGTTHVRLIVYRSWRYFVNNLDETLENLLEHLNKDGQGNLGLTSLRLPGPTPDPTAVAAALAHQASGSLSTGDADALVQNAFALGYTALAHHLRHAGETVSWYRGPLVPFAAAATVEVPVPGPDSLLRYDPQTGLFDTSYSAAWQLGQLIALANPTFSVALYEWKKTLQKGVAAQEEQAVLEQALAPAGLLTSLIGGRAEVVATLPPVPDLVAELIAGLKLLKGVPFSYLVPDQAMLPVESLRFLQVDPNWVEAVIDGAFSIGRFTEDDRQRDAVHLAPVHLEAVRQVRAHRRNNPPHLAAALQAAGSDPLPVITGFLLRSQAVAGWPRLNVNAYSDAQGTNELPKLRIERLSSDVLLCLFEGTIAMAAIHEAPEQLHCGVEGAPGTLTTTLRALSGSTPGAQLYPSVSGPVLTRSDQQTVRAAPTAQALVTALKNAGQTVDAFTSAEFTLEMIKGVVKVLYVEAG